MPILPSFWVMADLYTAFEVRHCLMQSCFYRCMDDRHHLHSHAVTNYFISLLILQLLLPSSDDFYSRKYVALYCVEFIASSCIDTENLLSPVVSAVSW
jgi:hypothetical protein